MPYSGIFEVYVWFNVDFYYIWINFNFDLMRVSICNINCRLFSDGIVAIVMPLEALLTQILCIQLNE